MSDNVTPNQLPVPYSNGNGSSTQLQPRYPNGYALNGGYPHPGGSSQQLDFSSYWNMLRRRRWLVLLVAVTISAANAVYVMRAPRIYNAVSTVLITSKQQSRVSLLTDGADSSDVNTDVNLVKTNEVMQGAAGILGREGPAPDPGSIGGAITVANLPNTNLISITSEWKDPRECRAIANAVADAFVIYERDEAAQSDLDTVKFLGQELSDARNKLSDAEHKLQTFQETSHISSISASSAPGDGADDSAGAAPGGTVGARLDSGAATDLHQATEALSAALQQQAMAEREIADLRSRLDRINGMLSQQQSGALRDDNLIQSIRAQLQAKQAELNAAKERLTPEGIDRMYPGLQTDVARLQGQLDAQVSQVAAGNTVDLGQQHTLSSQLDTLEIQQDSRSVEIEGLRSRVTALQRKVDAQPGLEAQLTKLLRDRDVLAQVYRTLVERQKQVEISLAAVQGNAVVVSHAGLPGSPIRPQPTRDIGVGILLALLAGCAVGLFVDYLDRSVRTWDDVRDEVGLPILATIPTAEVNPAVVWAPKSRALVAEAFRMLRSNINFVSAVRPVKTIMITSAAPGEGKSSVAVNLAASMAQAGKRVVLVDGDMRKPSIFRLLGGGRQSGLSEYLSGAIPLERALRESSIPGVWTIPVGVIPPNPAELLGSPQMLDLLARLGEEFDTVLIDTPPCLMVTDALILAANVDAVMQVIAAGKTRRDAAIRAREVLTSAHGKVVGAVLNRFSDEDDSSYNYYYYYYYYSEGKNGRRKGLFQRRRRTGEPGEVDASAPPALEEK